MPVGQGSREGVHSLMGVAEETTLGTWVTATSFYPFISEALNYTREKILVEDINGTRNYHQQFQGVEKVEGTIEMFYNPLSDVCNYIVKQALGGTVTSVPTPTSTADGRTHTFREGDMENNDSTISAADVKGLSFFLRRGQTSSAGFALFGCRVNQLTLSGEIGQPVKMAIDVVGFGASLTTFTGSASFPSVGYLIFDGVNVHEAGTIASTSSATANIYQSFEVVLGNNIQSDEGSYGLGSRVLDVLPPSRRDVGLTLQQRFDTSTAWDKWVANTISAVEIICKGVNTLTSDTGSTVEAMHIKLPFVSWDPVNPNVGDPGMISQEIVGKAYAKDTATNYAIQVLVNNTTTGY